MTLRSLLAKRTSADEQLSLSARLIEDRLVSVCRHAALYEFERALRNERDDAEPLDAEAIGSIWLSTQGKFYGSAIELTTDFRPWWSSLESLFLAPGSSYSYLYGQFAATALAEQYETDPLGCGLRLVELTAAGGTLAPRELLRLTGVDCMASQTRNLAFQALEKGLSDFRSRVLELAGAR